VLPRQRASHDERAQRLASTRHDEDITGIQELKNTAEDVVAEISELHPKAISFFRPLTGTNVGQLRHESNFLTACQVATTSKFRLESLALAEPHRRDIFIIARHLFVAHAELRRLF
jgi:hypothetical protein